MPRIQRNRLGVVGSGEECLTAYRRGLELWVPSLPKFHGEMTIINTLYGYIIGLGDTEEMEAVCRYGNTTSCP